MTGRCLDTWRIDKVLLEPCEDNDTQRWVYENGRFQSVLRVGMCLGVDVPDCSGGLPLVRLKNCEETEGMEWIVGRPGYVVDQFESLQEV